MNRDDKNERRNSSIMSLITILNSRNAELEKYSGTRTPTQFHILGPEICLAVIAKNIVYCRLQFWLPHI